MLVGLWFGLKKVLPSTPQCIVAAIVAFDAFLAFLNEVLKLKHFWSVSNIDLVFIYYIALDLIIKIVFYYLDCLDSYSGFIYLS